MLCSGAFFRNRFNGFRAKRRAIRCNGFLVNATSGTGLKPGVNETDFRGKPREIMDTITSWIDHQREAKKKLGGGACLRLRMITPKALANSSPGCERSENPGVQSQIPYQP